MILKLSFLGHFTPEIATTRLVKSSYGQKKVIEADRCTCDEVAIEKLSVTEKLTANLSENYVPKFPLVSTSFSAFFNANF